jgi:hypothetical protein
MAKPARKKLRFFREVRRQRNIEEKGRIRSHAFHKVAMFALPPILRKVLPRGMVAGSRTLSA